MRKTDRYTVPFPPAEPPAPVVYQDRFRKFPFWYRWYLRLLAIINAVTIEQIVRRHDLQELKRRLAVVARDQVDTASPALLPGFHNRLRILETHRRRISPAIREIAEKSRGQFLAEALAEVDPATHLALENSADVPETLLDSTGTTLAVAQEAVRSHLTEELEVQYAAIERHLQPLWKSLQTLTLFCRHDVSPLFPPSGTAGVARLPLRVVRAPLQELYQVLDLLRRFTNRNATEQAFRFAHRRARLNPGKPGAVWSAVEEFWNAVPLRDVTRLAWEEPHLEITPITIRTNWWEPFRQAWLTTAVERVGSRVHTYRRERVQDLLSRGYLIDRLPETWLPSELYPATLGFVLLLAGSEFFHDTRRVVTQLVIDGVFHHLDTRNSLHQAALQIDQSLERLTGLLGNGDNRGTLGEELHRIRQRSSGSTVARRRLVGLYERHRRRIRLSLEELFEALESGGTLVGRTLEGAEVAFEYHRLRAQSFSGDYGAEELLETVGEWWYPLGRWLRALYDIESAT